MNLSGILKISALSLIVLLIMGCGEKIDPQMTARPDDIPDEQSDSVTIVTMNKNIITMEMQARHIDRFYKKKTTFIDSLFMKNFDDKGDLKSTLRCKNAQIDESKNVVVCTGEVVVDSDNGRLETPKLTWFRDNDEVLAENGVRLVREDDVLLGERMRTDLELNNIEIIKVSAEGTVKAGAVEW